jgi:hypothetical protein
MAVADSDEERWARTGTDGCSGGTAPGSSGRTAAQGGAVASEEGIRGRGCGGRLGVWSQRGATQRQGVGRGSGWKLQAAEDRHRPESDERGPVRSAGGAAAKTGEGEPLTGGPPLQCRVAGPIQFEFEL